MPRLIAALTVMATMLLGCDSTPPEPNEPTPTASSERAASSDGPGGDPVDLIGVWAVQEAADEEDGTVLVMRLHALELYRECGGLDGSWRALHDGLLVVGLVSGSGQCGLESWPTWLAEAAAHRREGDGHALLDESGVVLARLTPGSLESVPVYPNRAAPEGPTVTPEARRALAPAEPLPDHVIPADAASVLGNWVPSGTPPRSEAHLRFDRDGTWHGSDGCNRVGGRWRSGQDGALLGTTGVSTLIGCENLPVASHMGQVARAGFQGQDLVLFDRRGLALGVYHRTG